MAAPQNMREYVEGVSSYAMRQPVAEKWHGILFGLLGDLKLEDLSLTARFGLLRDSESPNDVLPKFGSERRLPKYPRESENEYRLRLWGAWEIWASAGSNTCVNGQLTAAKFPGAVVHFDPTRAGPHGESPPFKFQFWIRLPQGSHYVAQGQAPTAEDLQTLRLIAFKFSNARYVPRGAIFEFAGNANSPSGWLGGEMLGDSQLGQGSLAYSLEYPF